MPTIREAIDSLTQDKRRVLIYAFEHGLSQIVEDGTSFVGVNIDPRSYPNISIQNTVGAWSTGIVRK